MRALPIQKCHCLCPVRGYVQVDVHLGILERLSRKPHIAGAVFNQKNVNWRCSIYHAASAVSGKPKKNVEPFAGWDSTQILPPSRSSIFLQMANPIPVPPHSSR